MNEGFIYRLLADGLLVLHVLFVAFVVLGFFSILVGKFLHWQWVRHFWFRVTHLVAIGGVALQAWLGRLCPLTIWEMNLREEAGDPTYSGSFIAHWLGKLLYYDLPPWVFLVAYSVFGLLVLGSWWWVRPERK